MRPFVRIDRCNNHRRALRVVGLREPTSYRADRLHAGVIVRFGTWRLRAYLLGRRIAPERRYRLLVNAESPLDYR